MLSSPCPSSNTVCAMGVPVANRRGSGVAVGVRAAVGVGAGVSVAAAVGVSRVGAAVASAAASSRVAVGVASTGAGVTCATTVGAGRLHDTRNNATNAKNIPFGSTVLLSIFTLLGSPTRPPLAALPGKQPATMTPGARRKPNRTQTKYADPSAHSPRHLAGPLSSAQLVP
jgi:hypothetical protein